MEAVTNAGPGRPRLTKQRRPGPTAQAEILDAAAELFTTKGFASTSTRQIAEMVGMRQASLYHHFATKDDILAALLEQTVTAPLELANRLAATTEPAAVRLYALLLFDSGQLMAGRWNLGALYLLPELRTERFSRFREERQQLRRRYREFATAVLAELGTDDESRAGLPFRIVETVINERSDAEGGGTGAGEQSPALLAEAGLRVLGRHDAESLRAQAERLLATTRST
ncbi:MULTISPECIES: TetR/AcrR family transcriptional regulator [unclassified Rhodococcus (in: high G+C Gram-positive bacteria)]|uniref:TetR/AcrR family transcriptional regulator n=1 Tax=unclassified Rhodococcus (in: high G+C Gram-positive bacteria) TaxID=192944 RepID=UPI0015CE57BF